MKRITIYPNQTVDERSNPYIPDFVEAINATGKARVINPPHNNPLLSILNPRYWGDVTIFNWFESIPDFKYGILQSLAAIIYVAVLRLTGRKVVYMLHDKQSHRQLHGRLSRLMMRYIISMAQLIITHSAEGVELVKARYPKSASKVHFIDHPTKCRLSSSQTTKRFELLVWGSINPYKGVKELLQFLQSQTTFRPRLCIVGRCSEDIKQQIEELLTPETEFIPHPVYFNELGEYIKASHFVLIPYKPESVLSSATLMDSLSFGAKVIGPRTGSFADYSHDNRLNVYCYDSLDDIPKIIEQHIGDVIDADAYHKFLEVNDWPHFALTLLQLLSTSA